MIESILAAILSLAPYSFEEETAESRVALVTPVAWAIADATCDSTERAFLVAQAWHETKFARYVLEDRCHDGPVGARCDAGRATGPWQVHRWCKAAWSGDKHSRLVGGAKCALGLWRMGNARCKSHHGGFAAQYRIGGSCKDSQQKWARRVSTMLRVRGGL